MAQFKCKDCSNRQHNCWGTCPSYQKVKQEYLQEQEKKQKSLVLHEYRDATSRRLCDNPMKER